MSIGNHLAVDFHRVDFQIAYFEVTLGHVRRYSSLKACRRIDLLIKGDSLGILYEYTGFAIIC